MIGAHVAAAAGYATLNLVAPLALPLGLRPALFLAELGLIAPALLAAWRFRSLQPAFRSGWTDAAVLWRAAAAGGALWLMGLGLMDIQARVWSPPAGYLEAFRGLHEQLRPTSALDALLSVTVIALAPALCEEFVFRGVVLPSLQTRLPARAALLVSSLLFGLIHIDGTSGGLTPYRVPFAVLVGVGFGVLRQATGTLAAPCLAHALLNSITFGAVLASDEAAQSQSATLPHPLLAVALLGMGGTVFAACRRGLAAMRGPNAAQLG